MWIFKVWDPLESTSNKKVVLNKIAFRIYKNIRNFFVNIYLTLLNTRRLIATKLTKQKRIVDKNEVMALINKLKPLKTDKELIRLGPDKDGGYVVPDDFEGIKVCFSPGVGPFSGFEKDLADQGMKIYMADASVEKPTIDHPNFIFIKKFIGTQTAGEIVTMEDWTKEEIQKSDDDMVLQMDIEGHEFDAILSMSPELISRFRIMIFEIHTLYRFWEPEFYERVTKVFDKLLKDHYCVHIHPNNCCSTFNFQGIGIPRAMEFSFIRKDRVNEVSFAVDFPHPLDQDNRHLPHVGLPKIWYGKN